MAPIVPEKWRHVGFRPSKSPGVAQCASFMYLPGGYDIQEEAGERADLGTALHELFYDRVFPGLDIDEFHMSHYAQKHQVDVDGHLGIKWRALKMQKYWEELKEFYPNPSREQTLQIVLPNGYPLSGTPDMLQDNGDYACILDLKTGETDIGYKAQLMTYALMYKRMYGTQEFYLTIFNPVKDYFQTWLVKAPELEEWEREIVRKMEVCGKEFRRGPLCRYCPNLTTCEAHRREIALYSPALTAEFDKITPAQIQGMRPVIQAMEQVVKHYKETERALLEQHGAIDLGDGYELTLATRFKKDYDVVKCLPVLEELGASLDQIYQSLHLTSESLENLCRMIAPPRGKGKMIQRAKARLKEAGAFTERAEKYSTLRQKQLPPDIQEGEVDG